MRLTAAAYAIALFALLIAMFVPAKPALAAWQPVAEALCAAHRGPALDLNVRYVLNTETCTADCYSYTLVCSDGVRFPVVSRYPARVSKTEVFFYENSLAAVIIKLLVFSAVAFFAFVATFGSKRPRQRVRYENSTVVALVGLTLYLWGTGAIEEYHYSLGRFVDYTVGSATVGVVVPGFVILNLMSFVRGWNYVFVAHPATPIVKPAVQGQAADVEGLANILVEGAHDAGSRPTYHYDHQAEKARALAQKLNHDSAVAEAKAERERRRAELAEAEQALAEARQRKEGKS